MRKKQNVKRPKRKPELRLKLETQKPQNEQRPRKQHVMRRKRKTLKYFVCGWREKLKRRKDVWREVEVEVEVGQASDGLSLSQQLLRLSLRHLSSRDRGVISLLRKLLVEIARRLLLPTVPMGRVRLHLPLLHRHLLGTSRKSGDLLEVERGVEVRVVLVEWENGREHRQREAEVVVQDGSDDFMHFASGLPPFEFILATLTS